MTSIAEAGAVGGEEKDSDMEMGVRRKSSTGLTRFKSKGVL